MGDVANSFFEFAPRMHWDRCLLYCFCFVFQSLRNFHFGMPIFKVSPPPVGMLSCSASIIWYHCSVWSFQICNSEHHYREDRAAKPPRAAPYNRVFMVNYDIQDCLSTLIVLFCSIKATLLCRCTHNKQCILHKENTSCWWLKNGKFQNICGKYGQCGYAIVINFEHTG